MLDRPDLLCFARPRWRFVFRWPRVPSIRAARPHRTSFWAGPDRREGSGPALQFRMTVGGVRAATPPMPWGTNAAAQRVLLDRHRMGELAFRPPLHGRMNGLADPRFAGPAFRGKKVALCARNRALADAAD